MQDQKAMCFSVMSTECVLNKHLTSYPSTNLTGNDFTVTVNLVPVAVIIRYSSARTFSVFRKVDICINFLSILENVDYQFLTQECWSEKVGICINLSDRQSLRDSSVIFQLDQDNVQLTCIHLFSFQVPYINTNLKASQTMWHDSERLDKIYLKCYNKSVDLRTAHK